MNLKSGAWTRHLVTIALPFLLIPAVFIPRVAAQTRSAVDAESAYGTQTGYFFFWDPGRVSMRVQSSQEGHDWWRLSDGEAIIDLQANSAPGVTTTACVGEVLDQLAADPATVAVTAPPSDGGGPVVPSEDVANFVLTTAEPDGREKLAGTLLCAEIVPGQTLLRELVLIPAHTYNERDLPYVEADGVDLFTFFALRQLAEESVVAAIREDAGVVVGMLATSLPCDTGEFTVLARGESDIGGFVVDPSSFTAVDEHSVSLSVEAVTWSLPDARRKPSRALAANEIGLVRGVVGAREHESFNVYYSLPAGKAILLAAGPWDCGEAGAAPVPIDID